MAHSDPPTPWVRRAEPESKNRQSSKPQLFLFPSTPPLPPTHLNQPRVFKLAANNSSKNTSFQNRTKSQKTRPWAPNGSIFIFFWDHLGIHFSSNSVTTMPLKLQPAKLVFNPIKPLSFGIESPLKFMFFQDAIKDPIFFHFFASVPKTVIWAPSSKSSARPNGTPNRQVAPK